MNSDPITPASLRMLADQLQQAGQEIEDYLNGAGLAAREIAAIRRQHVAARYAAAGALRNAASKLGAILPTAIGEL